MAKLGTEHEREVAQALIAKLEAKEPVAGQPFRVYVDGEDVTQHVQHVRWASNPMSAPPRTKPPVRTFTSAYEMFRAGVRPKPVSDEEMTDLFAKIFGAGVTPPDGARVWRYAPDSGYDEED